MINNLQKASSFLPPLQRVNTALFRSALKESVPSWAGELILIFQGAASPVSKSAIKISVNPAPVHK